MHTECSRWKKEIRLTTSARRHSPLYRSSSQPPNPSSVSPTRIPRGRVGYCAKVTESTRDNARRSSTPKDEIRAPDFSSRTFADECSKLHPVASARYNRPVKRCHRERRWGRRDAASRVGRALLMATGRLIFPTSCSRYIIRGPRAPRALVASRRNIVRIPSGGSFSPSPSFPLSLSLSLVLSLSRFIVSHAQVQHRRAGIREFIIAPASAGRNGSGERYALIAAIVRSRE